MNGPQDTVTERETLPASVIATETPSAHTQQEITRAETFVARDSPLVVPVIEETISVQREARETGRLRIVKSIEERQEEMTISTIYSDAVITRVPVDRLIEGPQPAIEQRGDTLVVPVVEEVLVTEKRLRLREEVHIRFERREEAHIEPVTLRREVVTIERDSVAPEDPSAVPQDAILLPSTPTPPSSENAANP